MATAISSTSTQKDLLRDLGASQAASIVVGVVIGSGIFLVPAEMMQAAGSARLVYLAWIVGGIFSFFGAVTYAQLGAMKPQSGGEYVYIRDAYGPLAGFLTGWTWTLVVKPSSLAAISTGIVRVLANFPSLHFLAARVGNIPVTWGQLVAMGFVIFVSLVNYVGVRRAGNFQLAFTILKIVLIVAISALAFSAHGSWSHFAERYSGAIGGVAGFFAALTAALWAYDGWSDLNMVAEEVRDPERNVPLALVGGLVMIGALYMLVNAAVQYALPAVSVAQSSSPMSDAVHASFLGAGAAIVVSAAMVISLTSSLNGVAMSGSRMAFALARDGNFFSSLAKVHPRFRTPHVATVWQAVLSICFLLIGGNFRQLFTLAIFAEWLSYMAASSSLFVFRKKIVGPERRPPYWQYPLAPALFIVASAALLYYTFTSNLRYSAMGSLVILAGIPVYYGFALRRRS
ncbi:MAG TPA: amino acid permease [Terriglobales bacterium]|jgi:APA family basic amino acid/polyamine antiporter|nr:amino acid permease [Terriglobales bacterium]